MYGTELFSSLKRHEAFSHLNSVFFKKWLSIRTAGMQLAALFPHHPSLYRTTQLLNSIFLVRKLIPWWFGFRYELSECISPLTTASLLVITLIHKNIPSSCFKEFRAGFKSCWYTFPLRHSQQRAAQTSNILPRFWALSHRSCCWDLRKWPCLII